MRRSRPNEDYEPTRTPSEKRPADNAAPSRQRFQSPDFAEQREDYPDDERR